MYTMNCDVRMIFFFTISFGTKKYTVRYNEMSLKLFAKHNLVIQVNDSANIFMCMENEKKMYLLDQERCFAECMLSLCNGKGLVPQRTPT